MNAHSPLPFDAAPEPTADHAAWGERLLRRQAERLETLAEAGLRMALAIERQATQGPAEGEEPLAPAEAAMAFSRVARAVRMTGLLQERLVRALDDLRARQAAQAERARAEAEGAAKDAEARRDPAYRHKARVEAIVERLAKADTDDEDEIDRLVCEAGERLDDEDVYGDVLTRPVGELVSLICRDLGLDPDWTRLAQEAWAKEEADNPRSPFFTAPSPTGGRRGGPFADPGAMPGEERTVERAGGERTGASSLIFDSC